MIQTSGLNGENAGIMDQDAVPQVGTVLTGLTGLTWDTVFSWGPRLQVVFDWPKGN
jgi:hypothetical protein